LLRRLDHYELVRRIGRGGMGDVYLAHDTRLDRDVALKILPRALAHDPERRSRFEREARAAAALTHPGIVTVYSVETVDDALIISMEYVAGTPLREAIGVTGMPLDRLLVIGSRLADAVAAAHRSGITHRDLKPENLMLLDDDRIKILDFGLAAETRPAPARADDVLVQELSTPPDRLMGTLAYLSPEQAEGIPIDHRTDLFSLSVLLYEMATGRRPFHGDSTPSLLSAILRDDPISITHLRPALPSGLAAILERGLAKDRRQRYQDASSLRIDLDQLREDLRGGARHRIGSAGRAHLPHPLSRFVGREATLSELTRTLERKRLLTLTGAGGTGKTRLAILIGARVAATQTDGAWMVELATVTQDEHVAPALVTALGLLPDPGQTADAALWRHLATRQLLIIVDNCEHLLRPCRSLIDGLLSRCPGVRILATSREALGIAGETTFQVPPLALPAPSAGADGALRSEAVRLLVQRARSLAPDLALTADDTVHLIQICRRLDGLPLALELAAAALRVLTPQQMAARLDDRFRILTRGGDAAPARQQTLRAAIDWSHDLLDDDEGVLFRRLSIFRSTFDLEAAERVGGGGGLETDEVLPILARLADKSLLRVTRIGGEARYSYLETIAHYAREQLADSGESADIARRHHEHHLAMSQAARPHLDGADQATWLDRLERDHGDLRLALDQAPSVEAALELSVALWKFWELRGHWREARSRFEALLARADDQVPRKLVAQALMTAGFMADNLDDLATARARAQESLTIWRQLDDRRMVAGSLHNLGDLALAEGDLATADSLYAEALDLNRELGNRAWESLNLNGRGQVAGLTGDLDRARSRHELALAIDRSRGDKHYASTSLHLLGGVALDAGQLEVAASRFREAQSMARDIGDDWAVAYTTLRRGELALASGKLDDANERLTESIQRIEKLGNAGWAATARALLGAIALTRGDPARATDRLQTALAAHARAGRRGDVAFDLCMLGACAIASGDARRGLLLHAAGTKMLERLGIRHPARLRGLWEPAVTRAKSELGDDVLAAIRAEMASLSHEEVTAVALAPV